MFHLGKEFFSGKQRTSLGATVWEKQVFLRLYGIQILKVTYLSYLGKDFESLTNKIQSFQRFENFRRFRVFIRFEKTETTEYVENLISVAD